MIATHRGLLENPFIIPGSHLRSEGEGRGGLWKRPLRPSFHPLQSTPASRVPGCTSFWAPQRGRPERAAAFSSVCAARGCPWQNPPDRELSSPLGLAGEHSVRSRPSPLTAHAQARWRLSPSQLTRSPGPLHILLSRFRPFYHSLRSPGQWHEFRIRTVSFPSRSQHYLGLRETPRHGIMGHRDDGSPGLRYLSHHSVCCHWAVIFLATRALRLPGHAHSTRGGTQRGEAVSPSSTTLSRIVCSSLTPRDPRGK